ncbi:serine/threonine-protein kinase [Microbacterium sp. LWH11-1.2]|uniref:serine/threonine-protein kinase n=1 Tax=Microbacterium sp. LWH11-1.2 TaxID=3135258 RepID=UPI003139649D
MASPRSGDLTGRLLGDRYELATRLGEGGMGVVYRGHDTMLRRDVAVKVFREGTTEIARTASESQLLAALNHPSLVTLYDAHLGTEDPRYLVMEYVEGPTLDERLRRGPLPEAAVSRLAEDLADALDAVHRAGIVHRDVKPANVLLRSPGVSGEEFSAKLADFGIAYLVDATRLTTPGTVIGSAAYLSPEQITGADPRASTDVYSLGLVLLEALTGRRAFAQNDLREAVLARLSQDPVIPSEVGHEWGALLTAMTARDPADRPTAREVVAAARNLRAGGGAAVASSATVAIPPDSGMTRTAVLTTETAALPPDTADGAPRRRRRWLAGAALAAVVVAGVITGISLGGAGDQPGPPPELPALEEPLAAHLQQLMDAVSP